jgi:hypothetical protein
MRKRMTIFGVCLLAAASGILLSLGPLAGASGGTNDAAPAPSDLTGIDLVKELKLLEIPRSGYSQDVNCDFATEVDGSAYCLDSVATDWTEARLVAAQIQGADVNPEMKAAAEAQAAALGASREYEEAVEAGTSEVEVSAARQRVMDARNAFDEAVAAWESTQVG